MEKIVGAAVEAGRRDNLIARSSNIQQGEGFRRLTGSHGQRTHAAFQSRDTPLKSVLRRVHDARVNIAELLEREEIGGMFGAIEDERGRLIDRHRARVGGAIGVLLSRVERERLKTILTVAVQCHCYLLLSKMW